MTRDTAAEQQKEPADGDGMGIIGAAKYKSGNIYSYAIVTIGVYLLANAVFLSGLLFVAGGLTLMPRFRLYVFRPPAIAGWALVIAAFLTLP